LAGFADRANADADLMEWHYGEYEGKRTIDIRQEHPGWDLFRDGCPGGETLDDVRARADRAVARLHEIGGDVLIFSHRDFLRVLAVRWCMLPAAAAQRFVMTTAALSILGYDHSPQEPVIRVWNDDRHLV
jgi:probable phosphoglycerate mutase